MRSLRNILVAFIALGIFLRILYFDLMEFKADEVEALLLTKYWLQRGVPLFGLMSGAGIFNPPGFIFVLLPVLALTSSPLAVGLYIAAFNIIALWLIYRLGITLGSPRAGLWAGAIMAAHPWLILYSRKIWAQSLLPFFVLLLLITIARCGRKNRSRAIFWAGPLLALTWQIHYSAYSAVLFFVIWFSVNAAGKRINLRWALAGFIAGLVILAPYLSYSIGTRFKDFRSSFSQFGGEKGSPFRLLPSPVLVWAQTSFAGGFGYPFAARPLAVPLSVNQTPLGAARPWVQPLAGTATGLFLLLAALGALLPPINRERSSPMAHELWLAFFAADPLFLYLARGREVPPHYFIIGLPAFLILAGLGLEKIRGWSTAGGGGGRKLFPGLAWGVGVSIVISGAALWLSFIFQINRCGGTAGDYGVAYRCQLAAAETLVEARISPGAIDARRTRDNGIGVLYLLDREIHPPFSPRRAVLIDSLLFPDAVCGPAETPIALSGGGPLKLCLSAVDL